MSRIAKSPIFLPENTEIKIYNTFISVNGKNGTLTCLVHKSVLIKKIEKKLFFSIKKKNKKKYWSIAGTMRSLINSMVIGVNFGFTKKLQLVGIGYRVSIKEGNIINLSIGFSHTINYKTPSGVFVTCPNQNEIILNSANYQLIGQVAAEIRSYRPPEVYKGKGIIYSEEIIRTKETKKSKKT